MLGNLPVELQFLNTHFDNMPTDSDIRNLQAVLSKGPDEKCLMDNYDINKFEDALLFVDQLIVPSSMCYKIATTINGDMEIVNKNKNKGVYYSIRLNYDNYKNNVDDFFYQIDYHIKKKFNESKKNNRVYIIDASVYRINRCYFPICDSDLKWDLEFFEVNDTEESEIIPRTKLIHDASVKFVYNEITEELSFASGNVRNIINEHKAVSHLFKRRVYYYSDLITFMYYLMCSAVDCINDGCPDNESQNNTGNNKVVTFNCNENEDKNNGDSEEGEFPGI